MTAKAAKRRPRDANQLAKRVVDLATESERPVSHASDAQTKSSAAVELGRKGGLKGGRARAEKLSPEVRRDIARRAASARWGKDNDS